MCDYICNHWEKANLEQIAVYAMDSRSEPFYLWGNELLCLHCGFHGLLGSDHLRQHMTSRNHILFMRQGQSKHLKSSSNAELYCGQCGDFQYSAVFDRLLNRKRPLYTGFDLSSTVESSLGSTSNSASADLSSPENDKKRSARLKRKGRGICNMGSTCFMSAVLQVLMHSNLIGQNKQMQDSFDMEFPCNDDTSPSDGGGGCVVCELRRVFRENSIDSVSSLVPAKLLYCVWNYADYLADYDQQDAHEFFIALVNGWNTHIRTFHYFPFKNATSPRARDTLLGGVTQIFSGVMQSKLTCLHCYRESSTDEDFIDISLSIDVKAGKSGRGGDLFGITDSLKHFNTIEELSEEVYCEKCKRKRPTHKQLAISCFPSVLVLHLKRFDALNKKKIDNRVVFPLKDLDMAPYSFQNHPDAGVVIEEPTPSTLTTSASSQPQPQQSLYDLIGVVTHIGTLAQGHYIAFVARRDDDGVSWMRCDDETVTSVSEFEVENAQGYLLYYGRKTGSTP